jgi:hypothetical protein
MSREKSAEELILNDLAECGASRVMDLIRRQRGAAHKIETMRVTGLIERTTPDDSTAPEVVAITQLGLAILGNFEAEDEAADRPYSWLVQIEADPKWVADGLDLTQARVDDMLIDHFGWIGSHELWGTVLTSPAKGRIRVEQGANLRKTSAAVVATVPYSCNDGLVAGVAFEVLPPDTKHPSSGKSEHYVGRTPVRLVRSGRMVYMLDSDILASERIQGAE